MKKLTYLLLVMFAVVLMSTSCEKDETVTPDETEGVNDGLMTLAELDGHWYIDSYLYDDILWTVDSLDPFSTANHPIYDDKYLGIDDWDLSDVFDTDWEFDTETMISNLGINYDYPFTKNENIIKIYDNSEVIVIYTIISYSENEMVVIYEDFESEWDYKFRGGEVTFIK
jgi:hypothetical protein